MSIKQNLGTTLLAIGMAAVPMVANATLTIIDNTDRDITAYLTYAGFCSNTLSGGTTHAGQTNVLPDIIINFACMFHASDCAADVYMTDDCAGPLGQAVSVASVVFDTNTGKITINPKSEQYVLTNIAPYTVQIDLKKPG
jgi:hypothetical protein